MGFPLGRNTWPAPPPPAMSDVEVRTLRLELHGVSRGQRRALCAAAGHRWTITGAPPATKLCAVCGRWEATDEADNIVRTDQMLLPLVDQSDAECDSGWCFT